MLVVNESKRFTFKLNGRIYTAYVQYYQDGDCSIEVEGENPPGEVYDYAWDAAEKKGLLIVDGYNGDGNDAA